VTPACPICGATELELLASAERIAAELALREQFFERRIDGHIEPAEMKDRTDVVRGGGRAEIRICRRDGVLLRIDDAPPFASDPYAGYVMEKMLRSYIDAFRRKEAHYRPLLPAGARVLEIGSYVGGFLHVAREWEWEPLGVDVGDDVAHFTASHGYPTIHKPLEECDFDDAQFDGVFIWNTFEQLDDPHATLGEVRRILKVGGPLVIRTPNAIFYAAAQTACPDLPLDDRHPIIQALGYNSLLGFTYRHGFGTTALDTLLAAHGFTPRAHYGDALIAPSHARIAAWARREEDEVNAALRRSGLAPWIEAVYAR
jgi:SAM-dependent methyltransferase